MKIETENLKPIDKVASQWNRSFYETGLLSINLTKGVNFFERTLIIKMIFFVSLSSFFYFCAAHEALNENVTECPGAKNFGPTLTKC